MPENLDHLSIEDRLTHVEQHVAGVINQMDCRLCRHVRDGW